MNQQHIKRILVLIVIGLSICLLMTIFNTDRQRLASGIIMMQQHDITANVGGTIKNICHKQGDAVKCGDILYEIDGQELTEEIVKAQTVIAKIEDDLRVLTDPNASRTGGASIEETIYREANAKAQQYQMLYDMGAISRNMLTAAQAERDLAYQALQTARTNNAIYDAGNPTVIAMKQEELAYAKQNLQTLQERSQNLIITSPADGIITSQIYQVGERVEQGYLLANIAVKENCTLSAYISEKEKTKLTEGQEVKIVIGAYPDKTFSGTVTGIGVQESTAAEPNNDRQMLVQIRMNNEEYLLRAGMQADIYID